MLQEAFEEKCILRFQCGRSHTQSSPKPKNVRIKTILIVFSDIWGNVHFEFVPQGQSSVNAAFYLEAWTESKTSSSSTVTIPPPHGNKTIMVPQSFLTVLTWLCVNCFDLPIEERA
ncbi:hypothetical protein J6590_067125 [Homalodisca vitripennis]|nr:hypothetical protein J6590_067125 [Homalodisca vitripennis]